MQTRFFEAAKGAIEDEIARSIEDGEVEPLQPRPASVSFGRKLMRESREVSNSNSSDSQER